MAVFESTLANGWGAFLFVQDSTFAPHSYSSDKLPKKATSVTEMKTRMIQPYKVISDQINNVKKITL